MTQTKQPPEKFCAHCGAQLERKRFGRRLEDFGAFTRRVYCNQDCMAAGYVKDAPSIAGHRWRAAKFRGSSCEVCGATANLHSHHIDGQPWNNCSENIQTLCGSCHASHHHHARRAGLTVAGRAT